METSQYELSHTIVPFFLECSLELATLVLFTTAPGPRVDRCTAEWDRFSFYYGRRGRLWPLKNTGIQGLSSTDPKSWKRKAATVAQASGRIEARQKRKRRARTGRLARALDCPSGAARCDRVRPHGPAGPSWPPQRSPGQTLLGRGVTRPPGSFRADGRTRCGCSRPTRRRRSRRRRARAAGRRRRKLPSDAHWGLGAGRASRHAGRARGTGAEPGADQADVQGAQSRRQAADARAAPSARVAAAAHEAVRHAKLRVASLQPRRRRGRRQQRHVRQRARGHAAAGAGRGTQQPERDRWCGSVAGIIVGRRVGAGARPLAAVRVCHTARRTSRAGRGQGHEMRGAVSRVHADVAGAAWRSFRGAAVGGGWRAVGQAATAGLGIMAHGHGGWQLHRGGRAPRQHGAGGRTITLRVSGPSRRDALSSDEGAVVPSVLLRSVV